MNNKGYAHISGITVHFQTLTDSLPAEISAPVLDNFKFLVTFSGVTRHLLGELLGTRTSIILVLSTIPSNLVINNMESYNEKLRKCKKEKHKHNTKKVTRLLGMVLELDYNRVFRLVTYLVTFSGFLLGVKKPSVCRDFSPSRKVTRFPRLRIQQLLDPVAPSIKSMSSRYFGNSINLHGINHAPQFTLWREG